MIASSVIAKYKHIGLPATGVRIIGKCMSCCCSFFQATIHVRVHENGRFFLNIGIKVVRFAAKLGMNLWMSDNLPMKLLSCLTEVGLGISDMALSLEASTLTPLL